MKANLRLLLLLLCSALTTTSCNSRDRGDEGGDPPDLAAPGGGGPDAGPKIAARLSGKVLAPEGKIPIAGALVYFVGAAPSAIPDAVYCDRCVHLPDGTPFVTSEPDGAFELPLPRTGEGYLVVQKGAFRRVRPLTVAPGAQEVPREFTTMPPVTDKARGDDVPKIAVVRGAWDPIELVLARMGLKATISKDFLGKAQVLSKDAQGFTIYGAGALGDPAPQPAKLLTDPAEIGKYHIVFLPCSGSADFGETDAPKCSNIYNSDPRVKATLTGFVKAGGRIYVSDWSYEYVRQIFPEFLSWQGQGTEIGSACQGGGGEQAVSQKDQGLATWLAAQGRALPVVKDAWTLINSAQPAMGLDLDGKAALVKPKVWVEAAARPVTTSFQHACGRVLYTTYHTQPTSEVNGPLEAQALALLYLILEVGVCLDPPVLG